MNILLHWEGVNTHNKKIFIVTGIMKEEKSSDKQKHIKNDLNALNFKEGIRHIKNDLNALNFKEGIRHIKNDLNALNFKEGIRKIQYEKQQTPKKERNIHIRQILQMFKEEKMTQIENLEQLSSKKGKMYRAIHDIHKKETTAIFTQ